MKKTFLLATILLISVISTACINNFAVQELNNKAKDFMDKGDYVSAIERLKSSVDLDDTVFETQYNLAVAYTKAEDYVNAVKTYNAVININPDFADSYYSLAVCQENLLKDIVSKELVVNEDGSISKNELEDVAQVEPLSKVTLDKMNELVNDSKLNYQIYLDKSGDSNFDFNSKSEELDSILVKYAK